MKTLVNEEFLANEYNFKTFHEKNIYKSIDIWDGFFRMSDNSIEAKKKFEWTNEMFYLNVFWFMNQKVREEHQSDTFVQEFRVKIKNKVPIPWHIIN